MNQQSHWAQGLEGPAKRIAETPDSPLCVLVGPGTGKTFSMMRRVARLLEEGVSPEQILVCIFTRTAATDLKKSLRELQIQGASEVNASTIHAFCFSFLSGAPFYFAPSGLRRNGEMEVPSKFLRNPNGAAGTKKNPNNLLDELCIYSYKP